jgi:CRP-like cAMP-binding protein
MSRLFELYGMHVAKGDYIFQEGEPAQNLFMVYQGQVEINRTVGSRKEVINTIGESQFFGEMALIEEAPRNANALALEDCDLIKMTQESFEQNIKGNPHFAMSVIRFLSSRVRQADDQITQLAGEHKEQRVINAIWQLACSEGKKSADGKWLLVGESSLAPRLEKLYGQSEGYQASLNSLLEKKQLARKKDTQGRAYLALPVQ